MDPTSTTCSDDLRHGARTRLRFVEERAFWEGRVNRSDIMERFGVSVPQATADLGKYQELAPGNLVYDKKAKAYVTTEGFRPLFGAPPAEEWLQQHAADGSGVGDLVMEDLPMPRRALDPWLVRRVVKAIRGRRSLHVRYQSMEADEPNPIWRWVTPRAFASDGLRWHARVYNHATERHEDLLFPRMREVGEEREAGHLPVDIDWETIVCVRIRPASELSPSQQQAVAVDFQMENGAVEVQVRGAMLYNFMRRMRLDRGGRLIEVANEQEVKLALRRVSTRFSRTGEFS